MTIKQVYDEFLTQKYIDGLEDTSIKSYQFQLIGFVNFIGPDVPLANLQKNDIDTYIRSLRARKVSKGTLHTYILNVRIFLVWATQHEFVLNFEPKAIIVPHSPKKSPKIYSDDEIELIFDSIENSIPWLELRDKAIIALMYDSGLRQMEVCSLRISCIEFSDHRMLVQGKGNKERYVPIGLISETFLKLYMAACPFDIIDNVFLSSIGLELSKDAIKHIVYRIRKRLPFELTSHKLRHNFATNYCIDQYERYGNCDSLSLQVLMGHSSLQTTEKYLHYATNIMACRHSNSHLDRIPIKIK